MTAVEELLVKIRLGIDAEQTRAALAVADGVKDWAAYQYERGRIDAFKQAQRIVTDEADKLGRDDE